VKIAIPRFGESVAPCFEYSATIAIFSVRGRRVIDQVDFRLQSHDPFDRVRLLRDQAVQTLICGGMQDRFEDLICAHGVRVISWVSGNVEDLLDSFLQGTLQPGTARLGSALDRIDSPKPTEPRQS
jgi:predicted Fe-Mo cluster-binding NifX family protein